MSKRTIALSEIQERIHDIYAAVEKTETPLTSSQVIAQELLAPGSKTVVGYKVDFDIERTDAELRSIVRSAIHNIAAFFEWAKHYATGHSIATDVEVQAVEDGSLALRIARDLDVNDKHPLASKNTSGVNPAIANLKNGLKVKPGGTITFQMFQGPLKVTSNDGLVTVEGEVINSKTGQLVMDLGSFFDDALMVWEVFLRAHGINVDSQK